MLQQLNLLLIGLNQIVKIYNIDKELKNTKPIIQLIHVTLRPQYLTYIVLIIYSSK